MDDNTANVIIELIKVLAPVISAIGVVWTVVQSRKNGAIIKEVQHQNNSLLEARVETEQRVSAANAEVARGEGRDSERAIGEQRAVDLLAHHNAIPSEVNVVEAIPLTIKGKES